MVYLGFCSAAERMMLERVRTSNNFNMLISVRGERD